MVNFILYNDDGDTIEDIIFDSKELAIYFGSICYDWQDLDEFGYRLMKEYNAASFQWDYLGGGEEN